MPIIRTSIIALSLVVTITTTYLIAVERASDQQIQKDGFASATS